MSDSVPTARGLVAGKYEVLHLIGRGGMGSVWEGRHTSLGTRVAIKFVDSEHAHSEDSRARFLTEARAAAAIQSKHAIQIYDHGLTEDGRPYIVMELLLGESLDRRIDTRGRLSLRETAHILGQVCRALHRAHEVGIIHRDLKPENVFLVRASEDEDEIAKVLDFGIAKIVAPPGRQSATSSTKTGAVLGTPDYMSPEQARGLRNVDRRTDLWALGVIAYKSVTGVLPFEGESVGDLLVKICAGPMPTPSQANHELPASFDAWFARALDRDPERRFPDALALSDALFLAAGLTGRSGAASSSGAIATPREQTPLAATAGADFVSDAAGTSSPLVTPAAPRKSPRGLLGVLVAAVLGGSIGVVAVAKLVSSSKTGTAAADTPHRLSAAASSATALTSAPATAAPTASEGPESVVPAISAVRAVRALSAKSVAPGLETREKPGRSPAADRAVAPVVAMPRLPSPTPKDKRPTLPAEPTTHRGHTPAAADPGY